MKNLIVILTALSFACGPSGPPVASDDTDAAKKSARYTAWGEPEGPQAPAVGDSEPEPVQEPPAPEPGPKEPPVAQPPPPPAPEDPPVDPGPEDPEPEPVPPRECSSEEMTTNWIAGCSESDPNPDGPLEREEWCGCSIRFLAARFYCWEMSLAEYPDGTLGERDETCGVYGP